MLILKKDQKRAWGILGAIYLALVILKLLWVKNTPAPWLFFDELYYKQYAYSIFHGLGYKLNGAYSAQFPPLYPLLIAPAFFFGIHWYKAILGINVLISSTIIFPVYMISRLALSKRNIWFVVILTILSGFHVVFSRMVMSENVFLPLFLLSFYLLIVNYKRPIFDLIFGVLLGACLLTKYLVLPLIPIMVLIKLSQPWITKEISLNNLFSKKVLKQLILIIIGIAILFLPWVLYTNRVGLPLKDALGFGVAGVKVGNTGLPDISTFPVYLWAYTLLFLFCCALFLDDLLFGFSLRNIRNNKGLIFISFCILALSLIFISGAMAWQYYSGQQFSEYHFDERYLIGLVPLIPVIALLIRERRLPRLTSYRTRLYVYDLLASAGIVLFCYASLVTKILWENSLAINVHCIQTGPWVFELDFPPVNWLANVNILMIVLFLIFIIRFVYRFMPSRRFLGSIEIFLVIVFALFCNYYLMQALQRYYEDPGIHGMKLSSVILNTAPEGQSINIYLDDDVYQYEWQTGFILSFNGIQNNFSILDASNRVLQHGYLVTSSEQKYLELSSYEDEGTLFYIYRNSINSGI